MCQQQPGSAACANVLETLKNPYAIADDAALTQTFGWLGAWSGAPSAYAVAADKTQDVVAAVNFARDHRLRLVVKGAGHSYQGTSNAPDSLLIWTRRMNAISLHEAFVAQNCEGRQPPQPAVSVGAGAMWGAVYDAVTTRAGRYVQGGGCLSVGVAGLVQSGGFGSFSKNYGLVAAGLLEAEIVTADGVVRIVNACSEPDLFWALKGGGGGSLGVVTKLTLRTRELPEFFGGVFGRIKASSDAAFRSLIARTLQFYRQSLFNRHWGEQIIFEKDNAITFSMLFQGLDQRQAESLWRPFLASSHRRPGQDVSIVTARLDRCLARPRSLGFSILQDLASPHDCGRRPAGRAREQRFLGRRYRAGRPLSARLPVGLVTRRLAARRSAPGARRGALCGQSILASVLAFQQRFGGRSR